MKGKFTIEDKLVVKVPGSKLSKILDLSQMDRYTQKKIMDAYNNSTVYAPNLTASKSEKLSATFASKLSNFRYQLSQKDSPGYIDIAMAFCNAFELDSVHTPNIVRLAQSIALNNCSFINIDILISRLYCDYNIVISQAELYAEFRGWKYYQTIKHSVGGVSIIKFLRFYIGIIQTSNS